MDIHGREVNIFGSPQAGAPLIILNTVQREGRDVWERCIAAEHPPFTLAEICIDNWNEDMSPWETAPIYKNDGPFTGGADRYLNKLTGKIIPSVLDTLPAAPEYTAIAGYSLAGLFALYALYRTDMFSRAASVSGSLWYPSFVEYVLSHELVKVPRCVYLSLGDKEDKARNAVLKTVRTNTERVREHFAEKGILTEFVLNEGNHFQNAVQRTAGGIGWILDK